MGVQTAMMGLAGSVIGAANVVTKIVGDDDGKMATKARMTRDRKIRTRKMNMKASRVKMGGKK